VKVDAEHSSRWMVDCVKALDRCKQPLLHGNVADQFLLNGSYTTALEFLRTYLREAGYAIVGQYDLADGLVFAEPDMRRTFERIVAGRLLGPGAQQQPPAPPGQEPARDGQAPRIPPSQPQAAGQPGGIPPPNVPGPLPGPAPAQSAPPQPGAFSSPSAAPPRGVPGRGQAAPRAFLQDPQEAVSQMRVVLAQSEAPAAFVIRFADKLTTSPENQPIPERQCLVSLAAAIESAAFIPQGPLAGRRNALIMVAPQLGAVPPWLYKDSPFITLVPVARPSSEEREHFARSFLRNFHGGADLPPDEVDGVARLFADLTDGLSAWDLDAVRRTSLAEGISISQTRELVAYFKHGQREDPWEKLDAEMIREAADRLSARVMGQPAAIDAVVNMLLSAKVGVTMSPVTAAAGKPKGVFFFVGPTGVGKTELAKALSEAIFGDDSAFARFDMSEYAEQHAAEKLTGSPPGFVGYEEGGHLTNRVREHPFSLLLFDEIEKAHPKIMDKFLQILEDGRLTDGQGQTAYFNQTVIIFTSNLGAATLPPDLDATALTYDQVRDHFLGAVRDHFTRPPRMDGTGGIGRPELMNRLGEGVVVFDILRAEHVRGIAGKFLKMLAASAEAKCGLRMQYDDSVQAWVLEAMRQGDNLLFGGRRVKTLIESEIEKPLNRWLFFNSPPAGTNAAIGVAGQPPALTVNGADAR